MTSADCDACFGCVPLRTAVRLCAVLKAVIAAISLVGSSMMLVTSLFLWDVHIEDRHLVISFCTNFIFIDVLNIFLSIVLCYLAGKLPATNLYIPCGLMCILNLYNFVGVVVICLNCVSHMIVISLLCFVPSVLTTLYTTLVIWGLVKQEKKVKEKYADQSSGFEYNNGAQVYGQPSQSQNYEAMAYQNQPYQDRSTAPNKLKTSSTGCDPFCGCLSLQLGVRSCAVAKGVVSLLCCIVPIVLIYLSTAPSTLWEMGIRYDLSFPDYLEFFIPPFCSNFVIVEILSVSLSIALFCLAGKPPHKSLYIPCIIMIVLNVFYFVGILVGCGYIGNSAPWFVCNFLPSGLLTIYTTLVVRWKVGQEKKGAKVAAEAVERDSKQLEMKNDSSSDNGSDAASSGQNDRVDSYASIRSDQP